jgi:hypothetical protein
MRSISERLSLGLGVGFGGGVVLGDASGAARLGARIETAEGAQARARVLARSVRPWGVEIGAATVFEDGRGSGPPVTTVGIAGALGDHEEGRESRFGGDPASVRIRAATLALDLLRRTLARLP